MTGRAQAAEGGFMRMLAVLLHYSTVCRDRASSHLPPSGWRAPRQQMSGTLLAWQQHQVWLAPTTWPPPGR